MPKFTVDEMRECQKRTDKIRNMCIIAHVDAGKTTLTDTLLQASGIVSEGGGWTASEARGITIKSSGVSMYFETDIL